MLRGKWGRHKPAIKTTAIFFFERAYAGGSALIELADLVRPIGPEVWIVVRLPGSYHKQDFGLAARLG